MENDVKANPMDELQTLMTQIKSASSFKNMVKSNTSELSKNLDQLSFTVTSNIVSLNKLMNEYNNRLNACKVAFAEIALNPFEKAIAANNIETLCNFMISNNPDDFFIPAAQQKTIVLLEFLSQISHFISEQPQFVIWVEKALLDFDTQDRHIREAAPAVLQDVGNGVSKIEKPEARMVLHLVRSLLLDFKE
ncbi:hypothetical protein TRFO_33057 [Tritrichomonas foetus]|uniref:Uncharacterized protein n=1 Tax=Tritrichomonas foetus TaxID=1144522 RepID=A0A1J4JMI0_9EUKA|nr:hypothetical protein TRFO_33057 [Tritrichomonas foetus]|eukprot:OHT00275.1 hypothetical protein TRFO_33057 [Tritrichomonas foetus]